MTVKFRPDEIMTFSGKIIRPLYPDPELIDIDDIAHALSNQCRFTGHTRFFYSVAQHSVLVSEIVSFENAMWGLLHDASEAYLSDIARPIKNARTNLADFYRQAEEKLLMGIADKFGLIWPIPKDVKWADNVLLRTEMRDLMPQGIEEASDYQGDFLDEFLDEDCWSPNWAEHLFLKRFKDLSDGA